LSLPEIFIPLNSVMCLTLLYSSLQLSIILIYHRGLYTGQSGRSTRD
jgi:hypothetical protein